MPREFQKTLSRYRALPGPEKTLVLHAAAAVLLARAAAALLPPAAAVRFFRGDLGKAGHSPGRVAWAVAAVSARLAGRRGCFAQSLAAFRLLRASGHDPEIRLGFRLTDGRMDGHAWVALGGETVVGGPSEAYEGTPSAILK